LHPYFLALDYGVSAAPFSRATFSCLRIFAILFCSLVPSLTAHEANLVAAKVILGTDGTYRFELSIDVVSSSDPALDDTISPEEAAMAVTQEINLCFDEDEFHPDFSPLEQLDVPDQQDVIRLFTEATGKVPPDAEQFLVHLSQDAQVYLIMAVFKGEVQDRRAHVLFPGEYSRPMDLSFMSLEVISADPFERDRPPSRWEALRTGMIHLTQNGAHWAILVLVLCLYSRNLSDCLMHALAFGLASMMGHAMVSGSSVELPPSFAMAASGLCVLFVSVDNGIRQQLTWTRYLVALLAGAGLGISTQFPLIEMEPANVVIFHLGELITIIAIALLTWICVGAIWQKDWYRWKILFPASLVAAGAALYWIILAIFQ